MKRSSREADYLVVVVFVELHFLDGDCHAALNLVFGVVRVRVSEQLEPRSGHDEDGDDFALE